jgi:plasmid replication initiation protein
MNEVVETDNGQMTLFLDGEFSPPLKDNIYTMEHPFFSLSKRKDTKIREYDHNGVYINITPSVLGMPTMFDKDVLVYCISHVKEKINQYEKGVITKKPSRVIRFIVRQFLSSTGRGNGGHAYELLNKGLDRLSGVFPTFPLFDPFRIQR